MSSVTTIASGSTSLLVILLLCNTVVADGNRTSSVPDDNRTLSSTTATTSTSSVAPSSTLSTTTSTAPAPKSTDALSVDMVVGIAVGSWAMLGVVVVGVLGTVVRQVGSEPPQQPPPPARPSEPPVATYTTVDMPPDSRDLSTVPSRCQTVATLVVVPLFYLLYWLPFAIFHGVMVVACWWFVIPWLVITILDKYDIDICDCSGKSKASEKRKKVDLVDSTWLGVVLFPYLLTIHPIAARAFSRSVSSCCSK